MWRSVKIESPPEGLQSPFLEKAHSVWPEATPADATSSPRAAGAPVRLGGVGAGPPGSQLLAAEEGLGLPAGGVHAERTAQGQLRGAALLGLEVCVDQVGQRLRDRREGQTVRSADPTAPHAAPAPRLPRGALGRGASLHLNY